MTHGMSERLYAVLAAQVGWPVPPMSERIAGLRFVRDGEARSAPPDGLDRGRHSGAWIGDRERHRWDLATAITDVPQIRLADGADAPFAACDSIDRLGLSTDRYGGGA
jgi:hypothetical protein